MLGVHVCGFCQWGGLLFSSLAGVSTGRLISKPRLLSGNQAQEWIATRQLGQFTGVLPGALHGGQVEREASHPK